ncbi:hypothetical protein ABC977_13575 [Thioalkalicoccus limnaeus]|uniref:Uncharacterized protein n=1 Tax=Thioalkalicoccus limnaeus TaxID=120681 RepID=A0ABV4BIX4_9GAMM
MALLSVCRTPFGAGDRQGQRFLPDASRIGNPFRVSGIGDPSNFGSGAGAGGAGAQLAGGAGLPRPARLDDRVLSALRDRYPVRTAIEAWTACGRGWWRLPRGSPTRFRRRPWVGDGEGCPRPSSTEAVERR